MRTHVFQNCQNRSGKSPDHFQKDKPSAQTPRQFTAQMFCFLTRTREAFLFCSQEQQRTELAPSFLPNENYVLQICEICVISSSRKQHFVFEKVKFQTSKHFPTTQNSKKQFWKVVSVRYTRYPIFDIIIIIYHDRLFIFPCTDT